MECRFTGKNNLLLFRIRYLLVIFLKSKWSKPIIFRKTTDNMFFAYGKIYFQEKIEILEAVIYHLDLVTFQYF